MNELEEFEMLEQMSNDVEFWKARFFEERRRAERAEYELWLSRQDSLDYRQQLQECESVFLSDVLENPSDPEENPSGPEETQTFECDEISVVVEDDEFEEIPEDKIEGVDEEDWYRPSLPTIVEEDPESIPGYYDVCEAYIKRLKIIIGSDFEKQEYGPIAKKDLLLEPVINEDKNEAGDLLKCVENREKVQDEKVSGMKKKKRENFKVISERTRGANKR